MAGVASVGDPVTGSTTGKWNAHVSAPIWSIPPFNGSQLSLERTSIRARSLAFFHLPNAPEKKAQPIGVITAALPVEHVAEVVAKISRGQGSYAFALDSKGEALAYPDQHLVEKPNSLLTAADPALTRIFQAMVHRQRGIQLVHMGGKWVYIAYLPLKHANWSLGLVIPCANLEQQLEALNLLTSVLGVLLLIAMLIALRQIRLFEQTRIHAEQEALVNRLMSRIRESLNLNTILQTTVDEVAKLLHLERASFSWYQDQEQTLEMVSEYRRDVIPQQLGLFKIDDFGDLGDRLRRGEIVFKIGACSYLALPVSVPGNTPGYLICIRTTPRCWSEREIELLGTVADQLAIAINQSRLHTLTQEQVKLVSQQAQQLKVSLSTLQNTQAQLIQTEKMSALGQMVAGVAHEINNPVSFIYGNITHAHEYTQNLLSLVLLYQQHYPNLAPEIQEQIAAIDLNFLIDDLPKMLDSMQVGAERIREIVLSLRNFSRLDEAEMKPVDLHQGIDSTLLILQHRLKAWAGHPSIEVIKEYGDLPLVECYAGQLNQVFMNILANAIDALDSYNTQRSSSEIQENPSTIRIRTQMFGPDYVTVRIADNGPGIKEAVRERLFDPFFTTKPVGKGTGLGLSISYQIVVEKHKGSLECGAQPGQGAEFWIKIPVRSDQAVVKSDFNGG